MRPRIIVLHVVVVLLTALMLSRGGRALTNDLSSSDDMANYMRFVTSNLSPPQPMIQIFALKNPQHSCEAEMHLGEPQIVGGPLFTFKCSSFNELFGTQSVMKECSFEPSECYLNENGLDQMWNYAPSIIGSSSPEGRSPSFTAYTFSSNNKSCLPENMVAFSEVALNRCLCDENWPGHCFKLTTDRQDLLTFEYDYSILDPFRFCRDDDRCTTTKMYQNVLFVPFDMNPWLWFTGENYELTTDGRFTNEVLDYILVIDYYEDNKCSIAIPSFHLELNLHQLDSVTFAKQVYCNYLDIIPLQFFSSNEFLISLSRTGDKLTTLGGVIVDSCHLRQSDRYRDDEDDDDEDDEEPGDSPRSPLYVKFTKIHRLKFEQEEKERQEQEKRDDTELNLKNDNAGDLGGSYKFKFSACFFLGRVCCYLSPSEISSVCFDSHCFIFPGYWIYRLPMFIGLHFCLCVVFHYCTRLLFVRWPFED